MTQTVYPMPMAGTGASTDEAVTGATPPVVRIRPAGRWVGVNFRDLWHYRELLYFLIWRDVKVRYKQTAVGAAWAILQPFLMMVVFSMFFGRVLNVRGDGSAYPVFLYTALLPWQLFANSLTASANSLVANQTLITKVYFPRLLVPTSAVLAGLVDFAIASVVLLGMMLYYQITPTLTILAAPVFVLLAVLTAMTAGLWLSALNVRYRDVRHTVPFLTQLWMFASPVFYPITLVPDWFRFFYGLNPMVAVIEGLRWAVLGKNISLGPEVGVSLAMTLVLFVLGIVYFRRMEQTFADVV